MERGSTITPRSQIGSELSGQQIKKANRKTKTQQSGVKVMATLFYDAHSIMFIDYLEEKNANNSENHMILFVLSSEELAKKLSQMKKNKLFFHQDHAPCHKSIERWQNCMNLLSNCFSIHRLLQIWPPATNTCSYISEYCFLEKTSDPIKFTETEAYFTGLDKSF